MSVGADRCHCLVRTECRPRSLSLFGRRKRATTGRVDFAPKDIHKRVSGFLAGQTRPDDSGNIRVIIPIVHQDGADSMKNNNCVIAHRADIPNDLVAVLPQCQVVAVSPVTIHRNKALAGVCVTKDDAGSLWL
jgi:hypothetical protein